MLTQREYEALDERAKTFVDEAGLMETDMEARILLWDEYYEREGSYSFCKESRHYLLQRLAYFKQKIERNAVTKDLVEFWREEALAKRRVQFEVEDPLEGDE